MPLSITKYLSISEIALYALNRLPPLYTASKEGQAHQLEKINSMKEEIHTAVLRAIGAVMRDPIRKSTFLDIGKIDINSTAHNILSELEDFVQDVEGHKDYVNSEELSHRIQKGIKDYRNSLKIIEQVFHVYGLKHEKLTAKNFGSVIRKLFREMEEKQSHSHKSPSHKSAAKPKNDRHSSSQSQQDHINDEQEEITDIFARSGEQDNGDDTFARSVRDWYDYYKI